MLESDDFPTPSSEIMVHCSGGPKAPVSWVDFVVEASGSTYHAVSWIIVVKS